MSRYARATMHSGCRWRYSGTVLVADRLVSREGVEADHPAGVVIRLVDGPQRREESQVGAPPAAELHDDAGQVQDVRVQLIQVEDLGDHRAAKIQPQVRDQFL